jgi:predicted metal-dependent phosphoesterase TrpH
MMIYDLHCHTNCSDGALSAAALINLAIERKVDVLSITDHDTLLAYKNITSFPHTQIQIVPGIEFSTQWQKIGLHILGLNVQPGRGAVEEGVVFQKKARHERAEKIAGRLQKMGLSDALNGAKKFAGHAEISRPHFARYMVEAGFSKNIEHAFKKHLGAGKPGDVKQLWASMHQVIDWIKQSGGVAIIAHPHKYKLTRTKLINLLDDFKSAGGDGIEVLSGAQDKDTTDMLGNLAVQKKLLASMGSDFHTPATQWCKPGMHTRLPRACTPVWDVF